MDNLTHSLIGFALGKSLERRLGSANERVQAGSVAVMTAVIGNNIPDVDVLIQPFFGSGNLEYLLHHRGYTHTFLASIPLGILSSMLAHLLTQKKWRVSLKLVCLGVLSVWFHLFADFCNNYGVHPFAPFSQSWFYGDLLFILEPLIWLALIPYVFYSTASSFWKKVLLFFGGALAVAVWSLKFAPLLVAIWVSLWSVGFVFLSRDRVRPSFVWGGLFFVIGAFAVGRHFARESLTAFLKKESAELQIDQLSVSPGPGNPFCWTAMAQGQRGASWYWARSGVLSLLPGVFPAESCSFYTPPQTLVQTQGLPGPFGRELVWRGEFMAPLEEFRRLSQENCRFEAFLRYSRIPIWGHVQGQLIAADLRYEQNTRQSFSRIELNPKLGCPKFLPSWIPPTHAQLLQRIGRH